jgi:hypothetical protein
MKASKPADVDDFLKHSMTTEDPYEEEIPEMLQDVDKNYKRQKEEENEVKESFQKQQESMERKEMQPQDEQGQQGIIPPIGIAKPELVDAVMQNIGDEKKILEAIDEAEKYERETPGETVKREVLGHGARFLENVFGSVGNIIKMVFPDLEGDEPPEITGAPENSDTDIKKYIPGTEDLREFTRKKTGKYLEPKNKLSKSSQEFIASVGEQVPFIPLTGPLAALAIPLVGQIAKEGIKWSGGKESEGDLAKAGVMTIASIANLGNARGVATQAMNTARDMIPRALEISAGPTMRAFNKIRNQAWYQTGSTPSKAPAMQMIEKIESQLSPNGTLNLHNAMQLRRDINEARKGLGAFNIPAVTDKASARRYLDMVDRALVDSMENYGTKVNPRWYNNYQQANQAFAVTERAGQVAQFIEKNAKPLQSDMAKVLFHTGGAGLVAGVGLGGTAGLLSGSVGAAALAGQSYKIINRMIRSPLIRSHYVDVLAAASAGNSQELNKALKRFDKVALKHEYPKEKIKNQDLHQERK